MKLLRYQLVGVKLLKRFKGIALLADEQGLGKTVQSLEYAYQGNHFPCIVVCPAVAKLHWKEEAYRHRRIKSSVCYSMSPPVTIEFEDIVIVNYDILFRWIPLLVALKPKLIILDEVHGIANHNSQRTKAVRKLCSNVKRVIALSGTPLVNRPFELWPTLNILRPDKFPSRFSFGHRYCNAQYVFGRWEFRGATRLKELNRLLTETCMIRRTKEEVLSDLPKKRHHVLPLEIKRRKEYEKAETDLIAWLTEKFSIVRAVRAMRNERFVRFSYLKHLTAQLKVDSVVDWIKEFLKESDGKLLVGTVHKDILATIQESLKTLTKVVTIDGSRSEKQRREAERYFRQDPDTRVLVGNIKAAGVCLNLPEAKAVLLAELPFTPGAVQQFIDRAHRLTTTHEVDVYFAVGTSTLDEKLCRILDSKMGILNQVLDGVSSREGSLPTLDELHKEMVENEKGSSRRKQR